MKFFLCWYTDPPDPRYWDWFPIDGLMVSLSNLSGKSMRKAMNIGLHNLTGFKGTIFLDAGLFNPNKIKSMKQEDILEYQSWMSPDYVSHMDYPVLPKWGYNDEEKMTVLKKTIDNAWVAKRWEKKNGEARIVYIIQGWDVNSVDLCAKKMAKLDAEHYGLGSLYRAPVSEIRRRVKQVRSHVGLETHLHLFGVSSLKLYRGNYENTGVHRVDSIDSSAPIIAGGVKQFINPDTLRRIHFNELYDGCNCPICEKYPNSIGLNGLSGRKKFYNKIRAIHNAYWYTKISHSLSSIR